MKTGEEKTSPPAPLHHVEWGEDEEFFFIFRNYPCAFPNKPGSKSTDLIFSYSPSPHGGEGAGG